MIYRLRRCDAKYLWPKLFKLIKKLCEYYQKYKSKLPSDLPNEVKAALVAIELACDVLITYDKAHQGGDFK